MAVAFAAVLAALLPGLLFRFGLSDDYALLMVDGFRAPNPWLLATGRPLAGVLIDLGYDGVDSPGWFAWMRLAAVLQVAAAAALAARLLMPWLGAAAVPAAVVAFTLPSFQVFGAWGVFAPLLPSLLLSLAAAPFALRLAEAEGAAAILRAGLATMALLILALCTYQPLAPAYWAVLLVALVHGQQPRRIFRALLLNSVVFVAGMLAYLGLYRGVMWRFVPPDTPFRGNTVALADLPEKALWLLREPVATVFSPPALQPVPLLAAAVAALAVVAVVRAGGGQGGLWRTLWRAVAVIACLLALHAPMIATREAELTFRTLGGLGLGVVLLAACGLRVLLAGRPRLGAGVGAGLAAAAVAVAGWSLVHHIAAPQQAEYAAVRERVAALPPLDGRPLVVLGGEPGRSLVGRCIGEMGCASSSNHWAAIGMVHLALIDLDRAPEAAGPLLFKRQPEWPQAISFTSRNSDWSEPVEPVLLDLRDLGTVAPASGGQ